MPNKVIKGPDAEKMFSKAQEVAAKDYANLKVSDPDRYYAIVMAIYKKMCMNNNCTPKDESIDESMSAVLGRLYALKGRTDLGGHI